MTTTQNETPPGVGAEDVSGKEEKDRGHGSSGSSYTNGTGTLNSLDAINRILNDKTLSIADQNIRLDAIKSANMLRQEERLEEGKQRYAEHAANATKTDTSLGDLSIFDLPYGDPPEPVLDPFLTPHEATVFYARGGTGKGLMACWITAQLIERGEKVMILDAEGHRREWSNRLRGLGLSDEQLRTIKYRSPSSDEWKNPEREFSKVQQLLREDCDRHDISTLIIDSYNTAASAGSEMGGLAQANEFFEAVKYIARHTLVLAHNTGNAGRFPVRPFGSIGIQTHARELWAIEKADTDVDLSFEDSIDPNQPRVVALELRNTKMNERSQMPPQFFTFSFFPDRHIEVIRPERARTSVADLIGEVLGSEPMTITEIVRAVYDETGEKINANAARQAMYRHADKFGHPDSNSKRWIAR